MTAKIDFVNEVLELPGFKKSLSNATVMNLRKEFGIFTPESDVPDIDWNFALMCASALTSYDSESANEAVLRIAQSCLLSGEVTTSEQKAAALLLLQREGNVRAAALAQAKGIIDINAMGRAPVELRLDAGTRVSELTIDLVGVSFVLNTFQKEFWDAAQQLGWLSISAPTSAGKSFIVQAWIKERLAQDPEIKIVYLAPTRALIEEVGTGLRTELGFSVSIQTLPWSLEQENAPESSVYIFTQERLHIHLTSNPDFLPDFVFIDEAQNIGNSSRGILMSQVISECASRNAAAQIIFASPLSANPEILVQSASNGDPGRHIIGESVTVSQNLIYVNQVHRKPREFELRNRYRGEEQHIGTVKLKDVPSTGQRLPRIAHALGDAGGNLIYANGAADAEKYAREIYNLLGHEAESNLDELVDLAEFIRETIHEKYLLADYVLRGVAFHYGDIPLSLKLRVEDEFKKGNIKYLACTSTLLEGVNLPCRNIFVRAPKKGARNNMTISDFWNLAGRAGRWGTEFEGNIFCIDTDKANVWKNIPTDRVRMPITISAKSALDAPDTLLGYMQDGAPKTSATTKYAPETEAALSFITAEAIGGRSVASIPGLTSDATVAHQIDTQVASMLKRISVDHSVVARHFGVSPLSIERLRAAISETDLDAIHLVDPRADDALDSFKDALGIIDEHLGGPFGNGQYRLLVANLLINWMTGRPLRVIIENKAKYRRSRNEEVDYPGLIREVLSQVERVARYEAPKFLSCYTDVLKSEAARRGTDIPDLMEDIRLMLELGVTRRTDMSLIANGLSRASAIHVGNLFTEPGLDESSVRDKLLAHDFDREILPSFVRKEIRALVDRMRSRAAEAQEADERKI
ncbi:DEAD/DEAH box helicase [Arthrobacter sp. JUb115]|uniref:DEAD/DEAH box helicase n=1 Tax=Arthrobacter sp. JUb115 TaxID=2485108 RepID=UPI0010622313|nr:DEAD/DEAH box helicase [Arthrobacter sp. JUb115]TDU21728.1 replicative superfamily II helicase [Arthrobacter sp. JUb115]